MNQRFATHTAEDEMAFCNNCWCRFHYLELDEENGLCSECRPEKKEKFNDNNGSVYRNAGAAAKES